MKKIVIILNNVRSSENVGAIFRTANVLGVEDIVLVGITPAPIDRFGRVNSRLTKASLGAEKIVRYQSFESLDEAILDLKNKKEEDENYFFVGVEQNKSSVALSDIFLHINSDKGKDKIFFIFGNEVDGLSTKDLEYCDIVVEIPVRGALVRDRSSLDSGKESLNVSVSVGIVLYAVTNHNL
jgi:tRNA G18 (ribose-2'-O)-methylase SpoU